MSKESKVYQCPKCEAPLPESLVHEILKDIMWSRGGNTTLRRFGAQHFSEIGTKGGNIRWKGHVKKQKHGKL